LNGIGAMTESQITAKCNMTVNQIMQQSTFERFILLTSKRLDLMTEAIIDRKMCSSTCPCDFSLKATYDSIDEKWLNKFGRTNKKSSTNN
jgi:hypothetical protein